MDVSLGTLARRAEDSDAAEWGARAGLVARGLLWSVIGLLALGIAFGKGGKADKQGAFAALRDQPLGKVLLVALAAAFAAHAVFRLLEGTVGRREEDDDRKRLLKRLWSLCRTVVYGALAVSTVRFLLGGGGSSDDARKPTADVMGMPGGRWLVGAVGVGLVIGGIVQGVRGVRTDFCDKLDMPRRGQGLVKASGAAGLAGRGLVYALVGSFLVDAAVAYDPDRAKGLDASLRTVAEQPFGTALLLVGVVALLAFGLWSFVEARYRSF